MQSCRTLVCVDLQTCRVCKSREDHPNGLERFRMRQLRDNCTQACIDEERITSPSWLRLLLPIWWYQKASLDQYLASSRCPLTHKEMYHLIRQKMVLSEIGLPAMNVVCWGKISSTNVGSAFAGPHSIPVFGNVGSRSQTRSGLITSGNPCLWELVCVWQCMLYSCLWNIGAALF